MSCTASNFRPYTPEERADVALQSLAYVRAARSTVAERHARLLWPSAEVAAEVPSGPPIAHLAEPEPWREPIDGAALLDEFAATLNRYLVLSDQAVTTLALWALHTWAAEALGGSPRLALISPEPQSGKTTALRALSLLVPRPLFTVHGRATALMRMIDVLRPTLLLDDAERWLLQNRILRAAINAGFACDGKLLRHSRNVFELPAISCFSPCAIALNWRVPDDIAKRGIAVVLSPMGEHETRERLDHVAAPGVGEELRAKAVRWSRDLSERIAEIAPPLAPLSSRARVTWHPLLRVAEAAGGDWPRRAMAAAIEISASSFARSESVELLDDIRTIFTQAECDRLTSESLIKLLTANPERPWSEIEKGRRLTPRGLALRLSRYAIRPRTLRLSDGFARGYLASDFTTAFTHYLSPLVPRDDRIV
jgi:putative DNA primase/helicase